MERLVMPRQVRERLARGVRRVAPAPFTETEQDRNARLALLAERAERAQAFREERYQRRLPKRYASASLADLTAEQNPDGRVSGWYDSDHHALLLVSTTYGVGKTHAAYAAAADALGRGSWVEAWTTIGLLTAMKPSKPDAEQTAADTLACDVLLLDDLGRERITDWVEEQVHHIVDQRLADGRRLILTTNLRPHEMRERYTGPLVDRLLDDAVIAEVKGESRRRPAEW